MNMQNESNVRGNIIKVPDSSPGLLFVNGQQRLFTLEGVWKSPVAPAANMTVEVEFDATGAIAAVSVVDAQQLAKERLNQLSGVAQEQGKVAAAIARQGVGALAARMGKIALGATAVLWVAWFFLPSFNVAWILMLKSFTFWEFLGVDLSNPQTIGAGGGSHGLFGLIGLVAIAAPIAAPFLRHPRAKYLNAMPLAFLLISLLKFRWDMGRVVGKGEGEMGRFAEQMAEAAMKTMMDAISFGFGLYVLFLASLVLATYALKTRATA